MRLIICHAFLARGGRTPLYELYRYVGRQRYGFLTVFVWNRVCELGMSFRGSYFFIIWRQDHFPLNVYANLVHAVIACHALRSRSGLQGFRSEIGYQVFDEVWNRVRVSGRVPHTLTQLFWKYSPGFFVVIYTQMGGHCVRRSLLRSWKLGLRIVARSKPRMFCEGSLGKIKFRAFPKRVGQRITLEQVNTTEWLKKNKNLN